MGVHDGHRKRLIGRFLTEGLERFEPHQVLELLLFYSIPRQDTNELAHRLMERFGSLSGVLDAPYDSLLTVKGVGENTAALLKLMPAITRAYYQDQPEEQKVTSLASAVELLEPRFIGLQEEQVYVLLLDSKARCLAAELLHKGSVNAAEINVRKITSTALKHNAVGVILAHNHPGGRALPSPEDVDTTLHLQRALGMMEIQLVDHLIFAGREYASMKQTGILR